MEREQRNDNRRPLSSFGTMGREMGLLKTMGDEKRIRMKKGKTIGTPY